MSLPEVVILGCFGLLLIAASAPLWNAFKALIKMVKHILNPMAGKGKLGGYDNE